MNRSYLTALSTSRFIFKKRKLYGSSAKGYGEAENGFKSERNLLLDGKNEKESIAVSSICYVASDKHNVVIYTTKYSYEVRKTMTETLKQLEPYDFVRIHKQYLVNLKYVKKSICGTKLFC